MTERLRGATRDTFRSFEVRNFRVFFAGQGLSQIGTWLQLIAQALLVLRLTGSGVDLGITTGFQFLPVLIFGSWAGLLADRTDKRRLMMISQSLMMLFAFVLGWAVLADRITVGGVYLLAALTGTANAFDNPARRVMITELVPSELTANAVSLVSAMITGARVIGPAVAGVLVATVGIGWCFIVNGISFLAVLYALKMLDPDRLYAAPRAPKGKGQVREGLRYVWRSADLRLTVTMMAVVATMSFNWQVLLPLLAEHELGGNETTYAFITTVFSVGSLIGSLSIARRPTLSNSFLASSCIALGFASAAVALAPTPVSAAVTGAFAGAAGIAFLSGSMAVMQLGSAPAMRGRVMALYTILFLGSTPIGGPLAGWIAQAYGTRWSIGLGAAAALGAGLYGRAVLARPTVSSGRLPVGAVAP